MVGLIVNTESLVGIQTALSLPDFCHTMASLYFPRGRLPFHDRIKRRFLLFVKVKLGLKMRGSLDFVLAFEPSLGHVEEENMIYDGERPMSMATKLWPTETPCNSTKSH